MLFYSDPAAQTFLKPVSTTFTKLGGTILKTIIVTPDQTSYLSQVRPAIAVPPAGDLHPGGPAHRGCPCSGSSSNSGASRSRG